MDSRKSRKCCFSHRVTTVQSPAWLPVSAPTMTLIYNDDQSAGNSCQATSYFLCENFLFPLYSLSRFLSCPRASLVAQSVKNLPAVQETGVRSLGQEDSLEKEMATHSRILARIIPWTEEPGRLQSMGSQRVGHDWVTFTSLSLIHT